MALIAVTLMLQEGLDPGAITDGITAATLLGLVVVSIRLAVTAYSERAKASETREGTCVTKLETCIAGSREVTAALVEVGKVAAEGLEVGKRVERSLQAMNQSDGRKS